MDPVTRAIRHVTQRVPQDAFADIQPPGDGYPRLEQALKAELQDDAIEFLFPIDADGTAGIAALWPDAAVLYFVTTGPVAISRELIHLRGAVVTESTPIGDSGRPRLFVELPGGRTLDVAVWDSREERRLIRAALEQRAAYR